MCFFAARAEYGFLGRGFLLFLAQILSVSLSRSEVTLVSFSLLIKNYLSLSLSLSFQTDRRERC